MTGARRLPSGRCCFATCGNGKFEYVPPVRGSGLATLTSGRGAAFGDLFNNGKIDVVISPIDGPPVLLRNVNPDRHHWVELKLVGGPKSPRDAVGATVYLTANGMRQREDVMSGGSYISSNDPEGAFRAGGCDGRGDGGDSLAVGRGGDGEVACGGSRFTALKRARGSRAFFAAGGRAGNEGDAG